MLCEEDTAQVIGMHAHVYGFGDLPRNWRNCFTLIDAHVVSTNFSLITAGTVIIYFSHCLVPQTPYIIECIVLLMYP